MIRNLLWLSATFNLHLTARHLPGILNILNIQTAQVALQRLVILRPCGLLQMGPLSICTCPLRRSSFCLTDSLAGRPSTSFEREGVSNPGTLPRSLDAEVLQYRANSFAASTSKTYLAQLSTYLKFCTNMNIAPVPLFQENLGRYIAFLSRRLCFSSVKQYLNVVRLVHLEAGFQNPLEKNWYVSSILKGVRR